MESTVSSITVEMLKIDGVDGAGNTRGIMDINIPSGYWKTKKWHQHLTASSNAPYFWPPPVQNDPRGIFPPKALWATYLRRYIGCSMNFISLREEDVDDMDNGILCNLFKGYEIDVSSEKCDIGTYSWPSWTASAFRIEFLGGEGVNVTLRESRRQNTNSGLILPGGRLDAVECRNPPGPVM